MAQGFNSVDYAVGKYYPSSWSQIKRLGGTRLEGLANPNTVSGTIYEIFSWVRDQQTELSID